VALGVEADLLTAAFWRDLFYCSTVLSQTFIRRSLQAVRHSRTARRLLDDLNLRNHLLQDFIQEIGSPQPPDPRTGFYSQISGNDELRMTNYRIDRIVDSNRNSSLVIRNSVKGGLSGELEPVNRAAACQNQVPGPATARPTRMGAAT